MVTGSTINLIKYCSLLVGQLWYYSYLVGFVTTY